jgi:hypothetical protein
LVVYSRSVLNFLSSMQTSYSLFLFIGLCYQQADAQNSHYWTSNYGPGGLMTPGATTADT